MNSTTILRTPTDRARLIEEVMNAQLPIEVGMRPYKRKRSNSFNAYYWGCVVTPMAEHCGYSPNQMHEELLGSYWGWETVEFRGHRREVPKRRTTFPNTLNWEEMSNYVHHCQRVGVELGVVFPEYDSRMAG